MLKTKRILKWFRGRLTPLYVGVLVAAGVLGYVDHFYFGNFGIPSWNNLLFSLLIGFLVFSVLKTLDYSFRIYRKREFKKNFHRSMLEQLKLMASEEEQLNFEKNVPIVCVPNEIVSGWVDGLYGSKDDTFLGPKNKNFISCFTADELKALEEFNQYFVEQEKLLPPHQKTIQTWLKSSIWRSIMAKAKETLERMRT